MLARTFAVAMLALLLAAAPALSQNEKKPPDTINFTKDIQYGLAGDVKLLLNMARPNFQREAAPAVVIIHGGGWRAGNRAVHNELAWSFADPKRGYVAVTISYRLAPDHVFPAQIEDAKCAVRYLRAHAKQYNIDPDRIGAVGLSAGAHLSMMLATMDKDDGLEGDGGWLHMPSKVQAAVSFVGPTDLTADDLPQQTSEIVKGFLGGDKTEKAEAYKKASPITYLNEGDSPMLLFQGTKDPLIPNTQAYRMAEAMTQHKVPGRIELILGAGHGWGGEELTRTVNEMFTFFDENLKKKDEQ